MNTKDISAKIQKGAFRPHSYLSNVAMQFFQDSSKFVSGKIFPHVPVSLSTSYYYKFNKGDLLRDNVARKPSLGSVAPAMFGHTEEQYSCVVDQVITGIDQIATLDFQRAGTPTTIDPRKMKAQYISEQLALHKDIVWAEKYFSGDVWGTHLTGVDTTPSEGEFYRFDNSNSDPVEFIHKLGTKMTLSGLRRPNKMCLGANVFAGLKSNSAILDRVKYQGSETNPANVTTNVLAQLFGLEEIVVSETVYNKAKLGETDDFSFVCNPNDLLLVYAPAQASILEPSAGYTFVWDMLGNGQYMPVLSYEGQGGHHAEYMEGLLATDCKVTCKDLGIYLSGVVNSEDLED